MQEIYKLTELSNWQSALLCRFGGSLDLFIACLALGGYCIALYPEFVSRATWARLTWSAKHIMAQPLTHERLTSFMAIHCYWFKYLGLARHSCGCLALAVFFTRKSHENRHDLNVMNDGTPKPVEIFQIYYDLHDLIWRVPVMDVSSIKYLGNICMYK